MRRGKSTIRAICSLAPHFFNAYERLTRIQADRVNLDQHIPFSDDGFRNLSEFDAEIFEGVCTGAFISRTLIGGAIYSDQALTKTELERW